MARYCGPKRLNFDGEDSFIVQDSSKIRYKLYINAAGDIVAARRDAVADVLPQDSQDLTVLNPPILPTYDLPPDLPPPPPDTTTVTVSFPNWDSLSCEDITRALTDLNNTMMTSRMPPDLYAMYQNQIATGKATYERKCTQAPPPPPPTLPTDTTGGIKTPVLPVIPVLPGAGTGVVGPKVGGAGGGAEKQAKKPFPWIWIVIGGTVLYLLTKSNK